MLQEEIIASLQKQSQKLAYILRFYRKIRVRSQLSLAEEAGLSLRNYQRIENGDVLCRLESLIRLSQILNVNLGNHLSEAKENSLHIQRISSDENFSMYDIFIGQRQRLGLKDLQEGVFQKTPEYSIENFPQTYYFEIEGHFFKYWEDSERENLLKPLMFNMERDMCCFRIADWWQCIHENSLKCFKAKLLFVVKDGYKFFDCYCRVLSSDPQNPKIIGITKDLTEAFNFKTWLSQHCVPVDE